MTDLRFRCAALLLAATALAPLASAQAAACPGGGGSASALTVGTVATVAPGAARTFTVSLGAGEGVIVDLANLSKPATSSSGGGDDHDHAEHGGGSGSAAAAKPRNLSLCGAGGMLVAPLPGEVFDKGGSHSATDDGERLRYVAASAGTFTVHVKAGDEPRELLVRRRAGGSSQAPVVSATLGRAQKGIVSSSAPMVFSFSGTAGQWVQLKSTSERDTVLRLAGPDRAGDYSKIAENDDSDGLNPMIRRKLPVTGEYYLQVDSLSDEPGEFDLTMQAVPAPKPAAPPAALRLGGPVSGKLEGNDGIMLYNLAVIAGHSYRLELTATYDGVVAIGLPNPVEPDDGGDKPDAGFSEVKSQDSGTTGTERLSFTARSSGNLMVRIKSFGIGDTDGSFTLTATDQGS